VQVTVDRHVYIIRYQYISAGLQLGIEHGGADLILITF